MALIEGIGDEVLVTFTVICIIISLVIAWVSTGVQDIQFTSAPFTNTAQQGAEQGQAASSLESSQEFHTDPDSGISTTLTAQATGVSPSDSSGGTTSQDLKDGDVVSDVSHSDLNRKTTSDVLENHDEGVTADNNAFVDIHARTALPDDCSSASDQHVTPSDQLNLNEFTDSNTVGFSEPRNDSVPCSPTDSQSTSHLPNTELRKRRIDFLTGHLSTPTTISCNLSTPPPFPENLESDHNDLSSSSAAVEDNELMEGHIRLRLKDLSDTERMVQVRPEDTIGHFKRIHFANELAQNKVVRLICNGRELNREDLTIQAYNLTDNCILHCLVRQQQQESAPVNLDAGDDLEVGVYMFPLFGMILALVWYCRVVYRELFDPMATFSLIGMTMVFLVALAASFFNHDRERLPIPAHLHVE